MFGAAYLGTLFVITSFESVVISDSQIYWQLLLKHTVWTIIALGIKRYINGLKRNELVREKNLALAQFELAALKQQISPHFIFTYLIACTARLIGLAIHALHKA